MLRLLLVVTAALARPPRSPLASSRPRALASTPATTTLHRAHAALRAWLDGPRDDSRAASALCVARARALARAAHSGERATLEAALAVAFDLTTGDRAALPASCARERRYDGLADLTNYVSVPADGASATATLVQSAPASSNRRRLREVLRGAAGRRVPTLASVGITSQAYGSHQQWVVLRSVATNTFVSVEPPPSDQAMLAHGKAEVARDAVGIRPRSRRAAPR